MMTYLGTLSSMANYNKKSYIDENFFINCSTPESAYLLGFIWGDGYVYINTKKLVYRLTIECEEQDFLLIEDIFNKAGNWLRYVRKRKNRKQSLTLMNNNILLLKFLEQNNYLIKSGGVPIILDRIPEDLKHYWWRGYFDADGCIYYHKKRCLKQFCFSSTYDQDWGFCENLFTDLGIYYKIIKTISKTNSKSSVIRTTSKDNVIKICEYIYSGVQFGLQRKYDKFLSIKNS